MASLSEAAQLAVDPTFVGRVRAAAQRLAVVDGNGILTSESAGQNDKLRLRLCKAVLDDPDTYGQRFAWALAAMPNVDMAAVDETISYELSRIWDLMAGVTI